MDIVNDLIAPEPPTRKVVTAKLLQHAWDRYVSLFGVAPHGTERQLAGLLELVPENDSDALCDSWETYKQIKAQWANRPKANR